jgi:type III pantothenate kinase
MPGRNLSRKALNSFTSQLPEVPLSDHYILLGKNTQEAIQSGIDTMSGLALQKYTEELVKMYSDLKVVFTGGDAEFYKKFISCKYEEVELMTLKGLRTVFINTLDKI